MNYGSFINDVDSYINTSEFPLTFESIKSCAFAFVITGSFPVVMEVLPDIRGPGSIKCESALSSHWISDSD